jgi:hypothetical protein
MVEISTHTTDSCYITTINSLITTKSIDKFIDSDNESGYLYSVDKIKI